jgi:hypothetical protein
MGLPDTVPAPSGPAPPPGEPPAVPGGRSARVNSSGATSGRGAIDPSNIKKPASAAIHRHKDTGTTHAIRRRGRSNFVKGCAWQRSVIALHFGPAHHKS